ncbi:MAG: radical SAM family heme chaperone HemW [Bacteroidaceae bacterium]|nr:radical SAM family heme chaperone HemW [Bacteroidaceae bacterium]
MAGLYIHIPFCQSRCVYCDFYSTTLPRVWQMPYVRALVEELRMRRAECGPQVETLYLGGGTPSQLSREALLKLFEGIRAHAALSPTAEITIEANPDDISPKWIETLRETPVNRVSMGVQSFDDGILRTLHRRHTAEQARRAVGMLQEAGYDNLSLDLIYGLPGQTLEAFGADVATVLSLGVPHLSAYALQYESGTQLYEMRRQGLIEEADEELSLSCYQRLIDLAEGAGLEHYEISNFARPGRRSRHNSSYWTGAAYVGLGAGAHSYDGARRRSSNGEDLAEYIRSIEKGERPCDEEVLDDDTLYNELVMLRLRTREGLYLPEVEVVYTPERRLYISRMAERAIKTGWLTEKADGHLCLTRQGLFVSDDVISDLMA